MTWGIVVFRGVTGCSWGYMGFRGFFVGVVVSAGLRGWFVGISGVVGFVVVCNVVNRGMRGFVLMQGRKEDRKSESIHV